MSFTRMQVIRPGLFSTFQDLGRTGWQHLGVPVSGAMDEVSHRVANLLVGNDEDEATLEITMTGPTLGFDHDALIALCGADLSPSIVTPGWPAGEGGVAVSMNTPLLLRKGSRLQFGARIRGLRAYLAIEGGFGIDELMGSTSTYARGALGGHEGRALRKGDDLKIPGTMPFTEAAQLDSRSMKALNALMAGACPDPSRPIRAVAGRESKRFTDGARSAFFGTPYTVSSQSDRMGYRLLGHVLEREITADMLSEAVAFGSVQVPSDGLPIVLMADRQSTGGYPRIAEVASVDLPRLAQLAPGESLRFELVDAREAQKFLLLRARQLQSLRDALAPRGTLT